MTTDEKIDILKNIQVLNNFYGCAIRFDKGNMQKAIEKSNIFFNYGVKLLLEDVILPILPSNGNNVTYYDSATHYGIQLADFVANTMYRKKITGRNT